jgi:hypothetical protein
MDRRKFPGVPEEVLPFEDLETPQITDDPTVSLEDLASAVAEQRRSAHALSPTPIEIATEEQKTHSKRGGAFGGALKRRIVLSDSERLKTFTNESDIALVQPENIRIRLFPYNRVEQSYGGVLFTADEYTAITVSAPEQARRLGAHVMANTKDRAPSARHSRRKEVVTDSLDRRHEVALAEIERLAGVSVKLRTLQQEIQTPGYSHMSLNDMNGLMTNAEKVFLSMFEAIVESDDELDDDRVYSLSGALLYNLTNDDYKTTFGYWKNMTTLGVKWTDEKLKQMQRVRKDIEKRAGDKSAKG